MMTIKVWLLVMVGSVHNGQLGAVQPHKFPTHSDCLKVASAASSEAESWNRAPRWRCVETTVLVKE